MKNKFSSALFIVAFLIISILMLSMLFPIAYAPRAQGIPSGYTYFFPIFQHNTQPLTANSYYLTTIDSNFIYNLGCELGTRDQQTAGSQDSVAVLDFSYPICNIDGSLGADLFGYGPATLQEVKTATKWFASGYYACTGSDHDSNLVIGVGTNNKPTSCATNEEAYAHGAAWSDMITQINQWALDEGILHQVQTYGASNIEVGWNTPTWSRAWVNGFEQGGDNFMLHFGDAAGCPYEDNPQWSCGTASFPQWTMEDVWFVSWGSPSALPLPLIYLTNGVHAKQWAYLSQYSVNSHGHRMDISGVFTQWQYCQQFTWCNNTDNSPFQAYDQMITELKKVPATRQYLRWKTDIRWILQSELSDFVISTDDSRDIDQTNILQNNIADLSTGLENPTLSTMMQSSLEKKLYLYKMMADKIETSRYQPAKKETTLTFNLQNSSDPAFITGTITMGGTIPALPYNAVINNTWQTIMGGKYLQVAAGSAPGNPQQGMLYILETTMDKLSTQGTSLLALEGSGSLTILDETMNGLLIQSENGSVFELNLQDQSLNLIE